MKYIKKIMVCGFVLFIAGSLLSDSQSFVKKKKSGPSVTECCDLGVDMLAISADIIADIGVLQQQLITISRQMIDNNKKCYLVSANKEQLKVYYDKTEQCKNQLEVLHLQVQSYTEYIKNLQ